MPSCNTWNIVAIFFTVNLWQPQLLVFYCKFNNIFFTVRNQLKLPEMSNTLHCFRRVYCKSFSLTNNLFLHSRCWDTLIRCLIPGTFKCAANQISDQINQETGEAQTTITLTHELQSPDCTLYNLSLQQTWIYFFNTSVILSHLKLVPVIKVVAHSGYSFISIWVPWESKPQPLLAKHYKNITFFIATLSSSEMYL